MVTDPGARMLASHSLSCCDSVSRESIKDDTVYGPETTLVVGDVSKSPSPWILESLESRLETAEPEAIFDRAIPEGVN